MHFSSCSIVGFLSPENVMLGFSVTLVIEILPLLSFSIIPTALSV